MIFYAKNKTVYSLIAFTKKCFIRDIVCLYKTNDPELKLTISKLMNEYNNNLLEFETFMNTFIDNTKSKSLHLQLFNEITNNYKIIIGFDKKYIVNQINDWNSSETKSFNKKYERVKNLVFHVNELKNKEFKNYTQDELRIFFELANIRHNSDDQKLLQAIEMNNLAEINSMLQKEIIDTDFIDDYMQILNEGKDKFQRIVEPYIIQYRQGSIPFDSKEIFIDEIEEFKMSGEFISNTKREWVKYMEHLPEKAIKQKFCSILNETMRKDWGGEKWDHYGKLNYKKRTYNAAYFFKGPSGGKLFRELKMTDLGKNGDQVIRLFKSYAEIMVIQHCHDISEEVRIHIDSLSQKYEKRYVIIDGKDTYNLFRSKKILNQA